MTPRHSPSLGSSHRLASATEPRAVTPSAAATPARTPAIQPSPKPTTAMAPAAIDGSTEPRARVSVSRTSACPARNATAREGSGGP